MKDIIELERKLNAAVDRSGKIPPNKSKRIPPERSTTAATAAAALADVDSDADSDSDEDVLAKWGTIGYSSSGSGSITYSTYGDSGSDNEDNGGLDGDDEGGLGHHHHSSAIAVQEARRQLRTLQTGAQRTDVFLCLVGGRLSLQHGKSLSYGEKSCALVPIYLTNPRMV